MVKFNQHFIKKLLSSRVFLFLISLILIAVAVNLGRESYRKYQLTKEINNLKSEIERLEGKNQQLADLMGYFEEGSYLEKKARLKLNLKRPGEKVVVLPQFDLPEESPLEDLEVNKEDPHWWKWWEYFFGP